MREKTPQKALVAVLVASAFCTAAGSSPFECGQGHTLKQEIIEGGGRMEFCVDADAVRDGPARSTDAKGTVRRENTFKKGKLSGGQTLRGPGGERLAFSVLTDGQETGQHVSYWPSGQIRVSEYLVNGKRQGPYVAFSPQGLVVLTGSFSDGQPSAEWRLFDENGTAIESCTVTITSCPPWVYAFGKSDARP